MKRTILLLALCLCVSGCGKPQAVVEEAMVTEELTVTAEETSETVAESETAAESETTEPSQPEAETLPDASTAGAANNNYNGKEYPIYCVERDDKKIALSFDAAWGNEDTLQILDILDEHQIKTTFFMTGGWVEAYPEDVKMIAERGHDLGNHSENHPNMSQLSTEEIRAELTAVHDKVKALTGTEMRLFRPPYGDYDDNVIITAKDLGYYTIQWDVDSLDWKDYGADSIIDTVINHQHLGDGSIILLHNGSKYTPEALAAVITGLQEKGYEIVPISQIIRTDHYQLDYEGRQK